MGCDGYSALARVYDRLNAEIDYPAWADFVEECFDRHLAARPELVLDLACGTGRMTLELARRGYDMIGVDGSAEMLAEAYARTDEENEGRAENDRLSILYLQQDLREFELYGTVGAVTCCLDSVNYLLTEEDVAKCFAAVHNYLDPDGLFLFDVNTPRKFREVYGDNAYILEDHTPPAVFCGWQNAFDEETGICSFDLSVFEAQSDGSYRRADEHQEERCYGMETLKRLLADAGMETLAVFGDDRKRPACEGDERWYFVARAKK